MELGKRGGMLETTLGKVVLSVIVLVLLIGLVMAFSGKLSTDIPVLSLLSNHCKISNMDCDNSYRQCNFSGGLFDQ